MELDPTHPRATPVSDELEPTHTRDATLVGQVIGGRYRLEARIAAGGMGEVYRAIHVELGRTLALKLMRPELSGDANFIERFRREAMTASKLGHPHIVDIIDSGRSEGGQFYFVMEFLDGKTLSSLIAQGPLASPRALDLVTQIAEALDVAHRAGVVHRDLKPDNVIVLERGGEHVKLVDFGIAKTVTPALDQKQTTHGVIMGTPQYMAPEQAAGVVIDARADIYALGLILFELLTGRPPFKGETAPLVMAAHISQVAPPLPGPFPSALKTLVARMLEKRPAARPESMARVLEALAAVPRAPSKGRAPLIAAVAALCGLGALLLLGAPPRLVASVDAGVPAQVVPVVATAPPEPDAGQVAEAVDAGAPLEVAVVPQPAAVKKTPPPKKKPAPSPVPGLLPADGL